MAGRVFLGVCELIRPLAAKAVSRERLEDVELFSFPSACGPAAIGSSLRLEEVRGRCREGDAICLLGSSCFHGRPRATAGAVHDGTALIEHHVDRCFDLFVGSTDVDRLVAEGAYLLTPTWLADWQARIRTWGFDQEGAQAFFSEFARSLVLLVPPDEAPDTDRLAALGTFLGLPVRTAPMNLDVLGPRIARAVLEARLAGERAFHQATLEQSRRRLSEYAMAHDLLIRLAKSLSEADVVEAILGTAVMFFAASSIAYLPVVHGVPGAPVVGPDGRGAGADREALKARLLAVSEPVELGPSGFAVRIEERGDLLGVLVVEGVGMPEHVERYSELAELLANIFALALSNARAFSELERTTVALRQSEDELRALAADLELRVAERTAELSRAVRTRDEFLASMSHELRTPLNAILGLSEALEEGVYGELGPRQEVATKRIGDSGRQLLTLVNDVIDIAKIHAGTLSLELGPVSLRDLCEASLNVVQDLARRKGLDVALDEPPEPIVLHADGRRLKQVLVSLLGNAVKFTPEGGRIGLRARISTPGPALRITVWDSGIGIAKDDIGRLFQPFAQLDGRLSRHYAGTGLGLYLAQRLVALHGGSMDVESEVGEGSRFTVTLPTRAT